MQIYSKLDNVSLSKYGCAAHDWLEWSLIARFKGFRGKVIEKTLPDQSCLECRVVLGIAPCMMMTSRYGKIAKCVHLM